MILITDGSCGLNILSLSKNLVNSNKNNHEVLQTLLPSLPFNFPAKFHIIALASPDEPCLGITLPVYQKIIDLSGAEGSVFVPDGNLSMKVSCTSLLYFHRTTISFLNAERPEFVHQDRRASLQFLRGDATVRIPLRLDPALPFTSSESLAPFSNF